MEGEGKRVGAYAVRNADPFPRWPRWTISLPIADPKNHIVLRLPLLPTLLSAGLAPRIHNVGHGRIPLHRMHSHSQINEAVQHAN